MWVYNARVRYDLIHQVPADMFQIAKFMGPTWGPPGSCRPQMGPMLAPWTLLSGVSLVQVQCQNADYVCYTIVLQIKATMEYPKHFNVFVHVLLR